MYAPDKAAAVTRAIEVVEQQIAAGSVSAVDLEVMKQELINLRTELENEALPTYGD